MTDVLGKGIANICYVVNPEVVVLGGGIMAQEAFLKDKIEKAVEKLANEGKLPPSYKSHKLHGNLEGIWECHITPDWLMLWEQNDKKLTLLFLNNGTHSDLF